MFGRASCHVWLLLWPLGLARLPSRLLARLLSRLARLLSRLLARLRSRLARLPSRLARLPLGRTLLPCVGAQVDTDVYDRFDVTLSSFVEQLIVQNETRLVGEPAG